MRIAVVGGRLQGTEAVYLAQKAGWQTLLIDRGENTPASGMCDEFVCLDASDPAALAPALKGVDLVVPALEDDAVLAALFDLAQKGAVRLAYDPMAYRVSCSKAASNGLFQRLNLPVPAPWPDCGLPAAGKPVKGSGSAGMIRITDEKTARELSRDPDKWVVQEYLPGTVYSIEVAGSPGNHAAFQVTELGMDNCHDCKRVTAPTLLPEKLEKDLVASALACAEALDLCGLMDVEAVAHGGRMKLLEIDARLPSQTPTAVFHSTGINLLCAMARPFAPELSPQTRRSPFAGVVYEHVRVFDNAITVSGEHIMADAGPLFLRTDFFGADEALAPAHAPAPPFCATLIICGPTRRATLEKRAEVIARMQRDLGIERYLDPMP